MLKTLKHFPAFLPKKLYFMNPSAPGGDVANSAVWYKILIKLSFSILFSWI